MRQGRTDLVSSKMRNQTGHQRLDYALLAFAHPLQSMELLWEHGDTCDDDIIKGKVKGWEVHEHRRGETDTEPRLTPDMLITR